VATDEHSAAHICEVNDCFAKKGRLHTLSGTYLRDMGSFRKKVPMTCARPMVVRPDVQYMGNPRTQNETPDDPRAIPKENGKESADAGPDVTMEPVPRKDDGGKSVYAGRDAMVGPVPRRAAGEIRVRAARQTCRHPMGCTVRGSHAQEEPGGHSVAVEPASHRVVKGARCSKAKRLYSAKVKNTLTTPCGFYYTVRRLPHSGSIPSTPVS
jgi:hypothetical protein